ncbi:succinoglycan biosynthesis protein exop [Neorhizobium sp. P12A]|uniref:GumC family protein n=1 Tax=Neorhizobium sp. P12A TaxID=2268027 RepID=UPI00165E83A2|nr:succinoglycan biosynthesis protein exop [Neorhizobium sp. P12A]
MSFSHANRNSPFPEIDAQKASRGGSAPYREDDRYPAPANIQGPSDAELIDILQRALRGDPYPVSGRKTVSEPVAEPPLTDRIRGILRSDPPMTRNTARAVVSAALPTPAALPPQPQILPKQEIAEERIAPPAPQPVAKVAPREAKIGPAPEIVKINQAAKPTRRGWSFGLSSIAFVAAVAISGAVLPAFLAGPPQYVATARLQLQSGAASQPGFMDILTKRIASPHLLSQVVAKLKLDRDPEFTGGTAGPIGVAVDLLSSSGAASDALSRAQATLRSAIEVTPNRPAGLLYLSVTAGSAEKSARIANMLADATVYDAVISPGTEMPGQASAIDANRKAYDQASAALAAFNTQTGQDKIKAAIDLQQDKSELDKQAADADKAVDATRIRLTAAKTAKLSDVLDGSLSPDLRSSPALEDMRDRYAAAKTTLSQLSAELGPRHPRLLAQQATVDDLRANIQTELLRLVAASDSDLKAALADQKATADRVAALSRKDIGVDMARFGQLQAAVEAARERYENSLQRTAETKPSAAPVPLSVASPAIAPSAPIEDNLTAAETVGFLMGLGIALCLVFLRKWIVDALLDGAEGEAVIAAEQSSLRSEPVMEPRRPSIAPSPQKFDAAIPVANDLPKAPPAAPLPVATQTPGVTENPGVTEDIAALQARMASLRAKVESYAAKRNGARR